MARTAIPAATAGASNAGAVVAQKTPVGSTVEGFAAFVESAQGWLPQKRGFSPILTPSLRDQPVAAARGVNFTPQDLQPAAPGSAAGNQDAVDPSDAQPPAVALLPLMPDPSDIAIKQTPSPQGSRPAKALSENVKTQSEAIDVAAPTPVASPTPISQPPASPLPAAPVTTFPAAATQRTDGSASAQAAGPIGDGRNSLSIASALAAESAPPVQSAGVVDGGSPSAEMPPAPTTAALGPPSGAALPITPTSNMSTPVTVAPEDIAGHPSEKIVTEKPDVAAIASPDNFRSHDAGIVTAPIVTAPMPAQPAVMPETSIQAAVAPPISATATMAEANRAVALRVSRAIASGEDTLTIELHPAELGHVAVHLAFHDGGVQVQMVVGRQETFQAFSQDRAALEQQFSQAGIDLGAGGLDLRYSQTPEPKQAYGAGSSQSAVGLGETPASQIFSSDNLVNIVA